MSFQHIKLSIRTITNQSSLHSTLKHIVENNQAINVYITVFEDLDNYYGLDNAEVDMFEDDGKEIQLMSIFEKRQIKSKTSWTHSIDFGKLQL